MSQGRISYSRVIAVGVILFAFSGSGYLLGRIASPVFVAQHDDLPGGAKTGDPGGGEKSGSGTALDGGRHGLSDVSQSRERAIQLALRNALTIIPPVERKSSDVVSKRPVEIADVSQLFFQFPPVIKKKAAKVELKRPVEVADVSKLFFQFPPVIIKKAANVVLKRPVEIADVAKLFFEFLPPVKMNAPVSTHEKADLSPEFHAQGVKQYTAAKRSTGFADPSKLFFRITPAAMSEEVEAVSQTGLVSLSAMHFQTTPKNLWRDFYMAVWHDFSEKLGFPYERALMRAENGSEIYFGGLTEREFRQREIRCLAKAIYHEARGEDQKGQFAVAQTIMNRVRNSYFPDTICGVIYENSHKRHKCQFSFACDGVSDKPKNAKLWDVAQENARMVADGKIWLDDIGYASHYHTTYVRPKWRKYMIRIKKLGVHIFYRAKFLPVPDEMVLKGSLRAAKSTD